MNREEDDQPVMEEQDVIHEQPKAFDEYNYNFTADQQRSVMSTLSRVSASVINREDPHIQAALELNHRFVDKNIHETLNRLK
jgi:hypothetical protein